ncbi:hypothetical protein JRO89_XS06G0019500 [Xanthoceras sorbifolium]|uniref:Uncharacterized protein n=1 Tax=Xanthoceras sorbifolium TaxID=99658 RepID=A0ABQ8HW92_9ROSI|nr:hypothetical protein JRO89_XS06G0019500 [Xanthoceras sorbifolium]
MAEEQERKKRVVVESLGWLTESSIMPKKQRSIEGVGASSILELKAQLYRSQEETKKSKELGGPDVDFHRAKKKMAPPNSFSAKNSGVEARAHKCGSFGNDDSVSSLFQQSNDFVPTSVSVKKPGSGGLQLEEELEILAAFVLKAFLDKLELKAVKDGSASYAALERKAELYDKLMRGELSDEEDNEKYCVDFFQKGLDKEESQQPQGRYDSADVPPEDEDSKNDASTFFNEKFVAPGRTAGAIDNDEHKRFVREVHEEVNQAREKASELKLRRQEQAESRREKLRQAYLRKLLEKQKAAPNAEQT